MRLLPSDSLHECKQKIAELTFLLNDYWGEDTDKPALTFTSEENGVVIASFPANTSITGMDYNPLVYDDIEFIPSTIVTK